jgi:hypothetical protein
MYAVLSEAACPNTKDQQFTNPVRQAFSLSDFSRRLLD